MANARKKTKVKVKKEESVPAGKVHIRAYFNNTIVTVTDPRGNTVSWATAGGSGFRGSRKRTPFAAQIAAQRAMEKAKTVYRMQTVEVFVKGAGPGREAACRAVSDFFAVSAIHDVTGVAHNGCRAPGERSV